MLDSAEQAHLRSLIQMFIAEKIWEGAGELELNDDTRVTITAQACLLVLGLPHNFYRNVLFIIVYPSTVVLPQRKLGFFENSFALMGVQHPILGQAFQQGPIIIVWDAALHDGRHPESGHNVIYHEFAHKLDMLDGSADRTPPLRDTAAYRNWVTVCTREYLRLKHDAENGIESFLDDYGGTNEAEFFAVATEQFFNQPIQMIKHIPDLYNVLKEYYCQDPAEHVSRKTCAEF